MLELSALKLRRLPDITSSEFGFYASCFGFSRSETKAHTFYLHPAGWKKVAVDGESSAYFDERSDVDAALTTAVGNVDLELLLAAGNAVLQRLNRGRFRGTTKSQDRITSFMQT